MAALEKLADHEKRWAAFRAVAEAVERSAETEKRRLADVSRPTSCDRPHIVRRNKLLMHQEEESTCVPS
jgi:hypothetical protein